MADRADLAAMLALLARATTNAELPVLDAHGLTMWAYVVLANLDRDPVRSQAALAETIGADKTRIIEVLDDLQQRGFITREPDPGDRRVRLIALTAEGRRLRDAARRAIQRNEERLLGRLPAAERRQFLTTLRRLVDLAPDAFAD